MKGRYDPLNLKRLEDRSRRPNHRRKPTWGLELAQAVLRLREQYPRWGQDKLVILLREQGFEVSPSMVRADRIGPNHISAKGRQKQRPYAVRKPKDYVAKEPGDIVQLDTLDVRPLPGVVLKHLVARDVISLWDVLGVYPRATAITAKSFLEAVLARPPFPIKALQVDGGAPR